MLPDDRYFAADRRQRALALEIYQSVKNLPLICPHGHVDARLFAQDGLNFGSPADLLIIPDHYVLRLLYSQGISLPALGVQGRDGPPAETDHRAIWQILAENFHLFRGTPSGIWLRETLASLFDFQGTLDQSNAQEVFDLISARMAEPDFTPRNLYERFNIEVLCTTDAATDALNDHQAIQNSDWPGRILPTFRPDSLTDFQRPGWQSQIEQLGRLCDMEISSYDRFIQALEKRRAYFKSLGCTASDHGPDSAFTCELSPQSAEAIFQRALLDNVTVEDGRLFQGHMMLQMARMSIEDGLVMQLHSGSFRNHNPQLYDRFGANMGADIPKQADYTRNLAPLLDKFGNDPNLTLILFTLDETVYARELAPLAGHYPAIKLGPPWWFHDSLNGMRRFFDRVMETASIYNTVGFNDDTRAFPSIPVRHDLWRRAAADWLAGLVQRSIINMQDAQEMAYELAYGLAKRGYNL